MNKLEKLLNLGFLLTIVVASCRKVEPVPFQTIDLGKQSTSTSIKSIIQNGTTVTAEFATTPGANNMKELNAKKYQISNRCLDQKHPFCYQLKA